MRSPFVHVDRSLQRASIVLTTLWVACTASTGVTIAHGVQSGAFLKLSETPQRIILQKVGEYQTLFEAMVAEQEARDAAHEEMILKQRPGTTIEVNSTTTINNGSTNAGTTKKTTRSKVIVATPAPTPTPVPFDSEAWLREAEARNKAWSDQKSAESKAQLEAFQKASEERMKAFDAEAKKGLEEFRAQNGQ